MGRNAVPYYLRIVEANVETARRECVELFNEIARCSRDPRNNDAYSRKVTRRNEIAGKVPVTFRMQRA